MFELIKDVEGDRLLFVDILEIVGIIVQISPLLFEVVLNVLEDRRLLFNHSAKVRESVFIFVQDNDGKICEQLTTCYVHVRHQTRSNQHCV